MSAIEYAEFREFVFNEGNPPGDPILQRLVAQLLVKLDTLISMQAVDKDGKPIKMKRITAKEYAPASFPLETEEERKEKRRNKLRAITKGIRGRRNG